jgi:predicted nucleic acid-binding protein
MPPTTSTKIAIPDANILIALCAKEPKQSKAEKALKDYANDGWEFYAPNIIVAEVLYVLCQKHQGGTLTDKACEEAVENFQDQMKAVKTTSDADLIKRAFEIQQSYGCSRSADGIYIALAEHLAKSYTVEIVTFDGGLVNQAAKNAQSVKVNVLPV